MTEGPELSDHKHCWHRDSNDYESGACCICEGANCKSGRGSSLPSEPPDGWLGFGAHAPMERVPRLSFSDEHSEDGMPLWERHMYDDAHACEICTNQEGKTHEPGT